MADQDEYNSSEPMPAIRSHDDVKPHSRRKRLKLQKREALKIVHRYMIASGAAGLIPTPFFNQIALGGLLAKMLYDLCRCYQVEMSEHKIKTAVASVLGGAHSDWISFYVLRKTEKYLPGANITRIVTRPVISAAITYSVGLLYIRHFEKGAWK